MKHETARWKGKCELLREQLQETRTAEKTARTLAEAVREMRDNRWPMPQDVRDALRAWAVLEQTG